MEKKTVGARVDVSTIGLAKLAASQQKKTLSGWIADVMQDAARRQLLEQDAGHGVGDGKL